MSEYKLERNRCDFHPETCCCHDYHIVNGMGRVAAGSNKPMMQMICDDANKHKKPHWRYYILTDTKGQLRAEFFETRESAEEFLQENYYRCTGDVLPVPE